MPQIVEVDGRGTVEFPDGMSEDEMASILRANPPFAASTPKPAREELVRLMGQSREEGRQADIMVQGWTSIDELAKMANAPFVPLERTTTAEVQRTTGLGPRTSAVVAGVQRGSAGLIESVETPLNVATLGAGAASRTLAKIAAGTYGYFIGKELPAAAAETGRLAGEGNIEGAVEAGIGTVAGAVLAPTLAKHALTRVAPLTADALAKKGVSTDAINPRQEQTGVQSERPGTETRGLREGAELSDSLQRAAQGAETPRVSEGEVTPDAQRQKEIQETGDVLTGMGGAVPSEFEPVKKFTTSNKNAVVDQEREARGLDPMTPVLRREWGVALDEANAKSDADPLWVDRLINELTNDPRPTKDFENAALVTRRVDLRNEFEKAAEEGVRAADEGRLDDAAEWKIKADEWSDKLSQLEQATGKGGSGTELGRGLAARRMMMREDFSLASLELRKRAARNFEPLTDAERAELQQMAIEHAQKTAELERVLAEKDQKLAEMEAQSAVIKIQSEAGKTVASPYVISVAEKIVASLDKRADAARARLRERFARTSGPFGIEPLILADLAEIGASHIGHLGLDFAKWSAAVINDVGEWVKPHLEDVFKASQKLIDNVTEAPVVRRVVKKEGASEQSDAIQSIKAKVEAGEGNDITAQVQKLARGFVEAGVKDRDALIDAVHAELQKVMPEITRRETMDAISGYGRFKQLTKDQVSAELRDLKGQMQQVGKLEDMQAGQAPKKTGVERRTPSDEERRLIKQVEEAKKKGGYSVTDPATQLRSALQATQRRLENQIADLTHEIESGERIVRERGKGPTSPEVEALREQRDALKAERDRVLRDIQENDPVYQAEIEAHKLNAQRDALLKSIADKERRLIEGDIEAAAKPMNRPADPVLEPLRQQRDALTKELAEARKKPAEQKAAEALERQLKALNEKIEAREAKLAVGDLSSNAPAAKVNRPLLPELEQTRQRLEAVNAKIATARLKAISKSPEERALQAYKTRTSNRIAELQKRLAAGDFATRPKREIKLDPKATELKFELEKINRKFQIGLERDRLAQRTLIQKGVQGIGKTIRLFRDFMTTGEFSVVLKQGGFSMFSRPIRTTKALADLFRSLRSEKGDFAVNEKIKARENYQNGAYQRSGLHLYEIGDKLSKMDEAVMSEWAARIPILKAFQRSFSTFLNVVRADGFDGLERTIARGRKFTPFEGKLAANFVNVNTGRGTLKARESMLVGLNTFLFAPRYWLSRLQLLLGQPIWHEVGSKESAPLLRTAIAGEYARALVGIGTVMALAKMGGAEVGEEITSTDFGKIITPSGRRIDLFAGVQQNTVFLSRMGSGQKTTLKGRTVPIRRTEDRPLKFGSGDAASVVGQLLRTKLAPAPGSTLNLLSGSDVVGRPVTLLSEAVNLTTPMTYGDIYKIMKEQGIAENTALTLLAMFGAGVQAYDQR